jgi:hypothetical protein
MHAYVQLFLDRQIDSVKQPFPFFHDEETAFTAVADSWEVLNNNCEFQRWRDKEFKAYVESNRTMLIEARIQHYSGVGRDRNNYDAYQNYLFINFESTKTYTALSKIRNQQDFLKTQILEDVFQEGSSRLLELIEKEFAVKISKAILLQIKNYFNIKIAALPGEMSARDIFNAAIKINSGLCDIFLFALGQFPFKPLQLIIQEMTKHDINKYYDYKYFEERMIGYFQRYNKDNLQEFLFDRNYFKPFQEYHKLFLAHLAEYNAGDISFSKLKEILRQEVQEKSKKFFTEKGFLFVLKEDGQRIIDTLEWLLKTEFIKEENVFLIEGLSLALRKEYLEKNEYLILKNYKRLVTFMRYYADLSSRAPLNAVAFKYLFDKFIDLHDLEDFISLFKSFYEEVTTIYLKVLRKLRER